MSIIRDCSVCFGGDPLSPNLKCCFNCAYDPQGCEVCHSCGHDCPEWKAKTNADRIRSMSDEDLEEWISALAYARKTPWDDLFKEKFCDNCHKIKCTFPDGKVMDLYECDFADGECPHGSDILWWLKQPIGREDNT